jgi:hypothetical protein
MGELLLREGLGNMVESTRDSVRWFTRPQPQRCLGASKVVEPDTSKSCLFDDSMILTSLLLRSFKYALVSVMPIAFVVTGV